MADAENLTAAMATEDPSQPPRHTVADVAERLVPDLAWMGVEVPTDRLERGDRLALPCGAHFGEITVAADAAEVWL